MFKRYVVIETILTPSREVTTDLYFFWRKKNAVECEIGLKTHFIDHLKPNATLTSKEIDGKTFIFSQGYQLVTEIKKI